MKPYNRCQISIRIAPETICIVDKTSVNMNLNRSRALDLIVKEWAESRAKEPPDPVLVPVVDKSTIKRINELQRTVEALTQKVSNLTLRERLGWYSGG